MAKHVSRHVIHDKMFSIFMSELLQNACGTPTTTMTTREGNTENQIMRVNAEVSLATPFHLTTR